MSAVMAGHLVVLRVQSPALPPVCNGRALHDGVERVWRAGSDAWREYRLPNGAPLVLQKIAAVTIVGTTYLLGVVWGLGPDRDSISAAVYGALMTDLADGGTVAVHWPLTSDATAGRLLCTALDADAGAAATRVKAIWPATWRVLLPTDPQGSGAPGDVGYVAPGPATGPRFIGEVVA